MIGYRKVLIARGATLAMAVVLTLSTGCGKSTPPLDREKLREFASDYAIAWSSQNPARVAACFAPSGSLSINDAAPAVGREAIAAMAKQLMTDFPDLGVKMEELSFFEGDIDFHWTLTGHNAGPEGTGKAIKISGYEEWTLAPDNLIATAKRYYDEPEYQQQLAVGVARSK
ncbi:MAG: nuclear transport factor 2 family protein [Thermoanaerobaculia bacterium]